MLADGFNFHYTYDECQMMKYKELDRAFLKIHTKKVGAHMMAISDGRMQNYWRLRQAQLKDGMETNGPVDGTTRLAIFLDCHIHGESDPDIETHHKKLFHRSFERTKEEIAKCCWWPGLSRDVWTFVKNCDHCNNRRCASKRKRLQLVGLGTADSPLSIRRHIIHIITITTS